MLDYLWQQQPASLFNYPVLTDQRIEQTELKLGVKLPLLYKRFMKGQNGGELAYSDFVSRKFKNKNIQIDFLFCIDSKIGIGNNYQLKIDWAIPTNIVIISGIKEEWVALDYRSHFGKEPKIICYSSETNRIQTIARSFEQLLLNLQLPDNDDDLTSIYIQTMHQAEQDFHTTSF